MKHKTLRNIFFAQKEMDNEFDLIKAKRFDKGFNLEEHLTRIQGINEQIRRWIECLEINKAK